MSNPCYPNDPQNTPIYGVSQEAMDPNSPSSFLYNLSLLHDKLHHLQSLSSIFHSPESTAAVIPTITTLIQEIIVTSTYMMYQMSQNTTTSAAWYNNNSKIESNGGGGAAENYDIVEVEAADLLAKYTHYCHVCGKGFKRDANLRMHMRAHGEEYKSSAALSNPVKGAAPPPERKYSCPQEGCRWNRKHERFQPLKSMVCVKNHYRRSHCPKMYVCKRCNRKQFSVVSDLRTHEKHCGDLKWLCSCGTTFSRKDKLMGHVGLFVGHVPVVGDVIGGGG